MRELAEKGVHASDFDPNLWAAARQLAQNPEAGPMLCGRYLEIQKLRKAAERVHVDAAFVTAKRVRLLSWQKQLGGKPAQLGGLLQASQKAAAHRDWARANQQLNHALAALFGNDSALYVPENLPGSGGRQASPEAGPLFDEGEVRAACPGAAEKAGAPKRLAALMDSRKLRPADVRGGAELAAALRAAHGDTAVTVKLACALLYRLRSVEVDLGFISGRFVQLRAKRAEQELTPVQQERLRQLVREATAHIAARDFAAAHLTLEELLILVGEPAQPSRLLE